VPWLAKTAAPHRIQQAVANPSDLRHFHHVVDAHDMHPAKNASRHRCGGGPEALLGRRLPPRVFVKCPSMRKMNGSGARFSAVARNDSRRNRRFASPHQLQPELNLAGSSGSGGNHSGRR
jgi:hypothetical protein